jgi:two-component system nitrogen regulation sensor histidine kinase NtrY
MGRLSATFNRMTTELRNQRNALIGANTKLDERRRFTEAVLSGVTAGVIGVDANGVITLVNMSALQMLHREERELIGKPIEEAIPEFAAIAAKAPKHSLAAAVQSQITYRREGSDQTFSVRVTQEGGEPQDYGFVITFDDITALAVAQRTTAWADVARRVAHEIKNPLTPIQLSAERIRRKYGSLITTDREVFDRCTDTIIRHVGDIGRMVDEFSAFARMPKPVFEQHNIGKLVHEAVVLFQMSKPEINYNISVPDTPLDVECDRGLLTQLVTNLVKNAGEAIESAKVSGQKSDDYKGSIFANVRAHDGRCIIEVTDNGCGLPAENRARLTEPYVTTREKGTGLGLAIVQRIAEQHDGSLELEDAVNDNGEVTGATVRLIIPTSRVSTVQQSLAIDEQAKPRLNGKTGGETHGV